MKQLFQHMCEEEIMMSHDNITVNPQNIKQLTLQRIRKESPKRTPMLFRVAAIAACATIMVGASGATAYAMGGPELRHSIGSLFGFDPAQVLSIGESVASSDYRLTVDELLFDGTNGELLLTIQALSDRTKQTFAEEDLADKMTSFNVGYVMTELKDTATQDSRTFKLSFDVPINTVANGPDTPTEVTFIMNGVQDFITIPLTSTMEKVEKDVAVPATEDFPVHYYSLHYSALGFTLIGDMVTDAVQDPGNISIQFTLQDGQTINFVDSVIDVTQPTQVMTPEEELALGTSDTPDGINAEWFAGSAGEEMQEGVLEYSFTFKQNFDWEAVETMTVNGTAISFAD